MADAPLLMEQRNQRAVYIYSLVAADRLRESSKTLSWMPRRHRKSFAGVYEWVEPVREVSYPNSVPVARFGQPTLRQG